MQVIEEGSSLKAAAAAFSVSPATAHRWWHRWCEASAQARVTLACLHNRSSRPKRSPRQLAAELEERICACRRGPRTNGKVERFHQTMAREWAYGVIYPSHRQRNQALPHWLDHYNRRRPHSSLGDRPPISCVHNVRG